MISMEEITIRELKQQAGPVPLVVRFLAQLERIFEKITKTGNPFYELTFADAEETGSASLEQFPDVRDLRAIAGRHLF